MSAVLKKGRARAGERHTSASPSEKFNAEAPLQALDRFGQSRLGDTQDLGRSPEVQLFGDGDEVPEVPHLYVIHASRLSVSN
ncbi:hypothetical protein GCM10009590_17990 [Brachybacterium alimentarium]